MVNRIWNCNVLFIVIFGILFLGFLMIWSKEVLINYWYVELDGDGGVELVKLVVKRMGFIYVGLVS